MGTKSNPGRFDCLPNLKPDEPYFVLRAQDKGASKCVRDWAARAHQMGVPADKVNEAWNVAGEMDKWLIANGGKVPD